MYTWEESYKKLVFAGRLEEAKDLLVQEVPKDKVIFKYFRGINRDFHCISSNEMWLSNARNLNDPFDCAYLENKRTKSTYDRNTESELALSEFRAQRIQDIESANKQSSVFVSCFSETNDSILMWSHYANDHKGICVGYNLHELISRFNCYPVIYSNRVYVFDNNDSMNSMQSGALIKAEKWKYEQEWRVFEIDRKSKGKNGKRIDFITPCTIYLGCQEERTVTDNHRLAKERNECSCQILKGEQYHVDINKIIHFARSQSISLYRFEVSRKDFSLKEKHIHI